MQLGAEAIFVGSESSAKERATTLDVENDPKEREEAVSRAKAIVIATTHYDDPEDFCRGERTGDRTMKATLLLQRSRVTVTANTRLVNRRPQNLSWKCLALPAFVSKRNRAQEHED